MNITRILAFVILTTTLHSCKSKPVEEKKTETRYCLSDSLKKMISIDTVSIQFVDEDLKLSGEISFNENKVVKIYPFSSGQVLETLGSIGDPVQKGQVLARIKSADIAGLYSDLNSAGNDVTLAKKQFENINSLFKNGIASEKEMLEAKEELSKAETQYRKINESIRINGNGMTDASGSYAISAPISGYLVSKDISQGAFIRNDNSQSLFTVGSIDEVWVWANVYETDIAKIREGASVAVSTLAYPDTTFIGVIDKVNQVLDPVTKVMKVRIRINNTHHLLKPEMFATIHVKNKSTKKAAAVSASAIISDHGKSYIIVYKADCDIAVTEVKIKQQTSQVVYLEDALEPGTKIITKNQILIYNGIKED